MSAIAKTIWLIETHVGEPLALNDMAAHAGVSRSHLSRIFPMATGYSISAYIRGRRMSAAAEALADGAPDILVVAIECGYGSHEAFTRAFREHFGLTPEDLRRKRTLASLRLMEPLPMHTTEPTQLADPSFERRPTMRIAGLAGWHEMTDSNTIPAQWQSFQQFIGHVPGAKAGAAYGVVGNADERRFEYMCGLEVAPSAELPDDFAEYNIPAQRYARFRHHGHISAIRNTINAIYQRWLPVSGERQAEHYGMIEYYGPDFNAETGTGTVEIWFGLEG